MVEVAGGIRQAVGVIDSQGIDRSRAQQIEDELVGAGEHLGILHADRGEGSDVEEAPVVRLRVADLPVGEPIVLAVDEHVHRQGLGSLGDGEDMVEVAQHPLLAALGLGGHDHAVQHELLVGEHLADARAEYRHEDGRIDGHVEPGGVGGVRAVAQDGPQRQVVPRGCGHGHVIGHDVQDQAHARRMDVGGEALEPRAPAHDFTDTCVVDDVVAVRRSRGGGEHGGQVDIGDTQVLQVGHQIAGVVEGEGAPHLEPVGRYGGPAPVRGHVPGPWGVSLGGGRRLGGRRAVLLMRFGHRVLSLPSVGAGQAAAVSAADVRNSMERASTTTWSPALSESWDSLSTAGAVARATAQHSL